MSTIRLFYANIIDKYNKRQKHHMPCDL